MAHRLAQDMNVGLEFVPIDRTHAAIAVNGGSVDVVISGMARALERVNRLGLLPRFSYSGPQTLQFARGDILVLITDGFLEWSNANDEDFGEDRLKEVIHAHRDMSSAAIISESYSAVVSCRIDATA